MRCFVACFLTAESALRLQAQLRTAWRPPARARLVPHANYHVTLKFIGDVRPTDAPALLAAVAALDGHALRCTTGPVTGFPRPARARVIAVGLEPASPLVAWADALSGLNPAPELGTGSGPGPETVPEPGPEMEHRPFVPHVTVARIRGAMRVPKLDDLAGLELTLEAPSLFESVPVNGGVRYQRVDPEPSGSA